MARTVEVEVETTYEESERTGQRKTDRGLVKIISTIARYVVWIIAIVPLFISKILASLFGGVGTLAVSAAMFVFGIMVNTNSYWQAMGFDSFFPWYYESPWTGWNSWGDILQYWLFYVALLWSIGTSVIQGRVVRGNRAKVNKAVFEMWNSINLPGQPGEDKLKMAEIAWRQLKNSGVAQNNLVTYGAGAVWVSEFIVSFAQNNPFRFSDPGLVAGAFLFIFATCAAPEFGFAIFTDTLDRFKLEDKMVTEEVSRGNS